MEHITDLKYILGVADRKYAKPCQKGTWEEKTTMFCPSDLGKLIDWQEEHEHTGQNLTQKEPAIIPCIDQQVWQEAGFCPSFLTTASKHQAALCR